MTLIFLFLNFVWMNTKISDPVRVLSFEYSISTEDIPIAFATAVHQFYHTRNVTVPDIVRVIWSRIKYIICFQLWCLCDAQLFVCLVMIESVENGSFWMSISSERISLPLPPQRERERVSSTDSLLLVYSSFSLSLWFLILYSPPFIHCDF